MSFTVQGGHLPPGGGGDAPGIQPLGDRIGAERAEGAVGEEFSVDVPVVDLADNLGLLRDDAQGVPLFTGQLIAFIAVGGLAGDIFSLGQRGPAARWSSRLIVLYSAGT